MEVLGRLHALYAWSLLVLLLSGAALYLPALRAPLASVRVPLRNFHIAAGLFQTALVCVYLTRAGAHWRALGFWLGKRINVVIALILAAGWTASGIVLWWERALLPYAPLALRWHDILTVAGLAFFAGHALVRWLKIDLALPWARWSERPRRSPANPIAAYRLAKAIQRRRLLTRLLAHGGLVLAGTWIAGWWIKRQRSLEPLLAALNEPPPAYPLPRPDPRSDPPIGGGARGHFRIYNVAPKMPVFDPHSWRLEIDGLVRRPLSLTWEEVLELPRDVWVRDFHCVSGWSVYRVTWEGIALSELLSRAGVLPQATHVKFVSFDGVYTDSLTLPQALLDDTFLALLKDGKPLTVPEGAPMRLIMPRMFAYKSVKWLTRIELIDHPHVGFWERLGYAEDAWIPGAARDGPSEKVPS